MTVWFRSARIATRVSLNCAVLLWLFASASPGQWRWGRGAPSATQSLAAAQHSDSADAAEHARLLALGKKLFLQRCASCHNERGDKLLSSGPPLNERKLTAEVIVRNVNGRLKNAAEEDRRGVTLYIQSFLKR